MHCWSISTLEASFLFVSTFGHLVYAQICSDLIDKQWKRSTLRTFSLLTKREADSEVVGWFIVTQN